MNKRAIPAVLTLLVAAGCAGNGLKTYSVDMFVGNVSVSTNGGKQWMTPESGMELPQGTLVRTRGDSYVVLNMPDRGTLKISYDSDVDLAELTRHHETVSVDGGTVALDIDKKLTRGETFEVETTTATAAVRGTEFAVDSGTGNSEVIVREGTVAVSPRVDLVYIDDDKVTSAIEEFIRIEVHERQGLNVSAYQAKALSDVIRKTWESGATLEELKAAIEQAMRDLGLQPVYLDQQSVGKLFSCLMRPGFGTSSAGNAASSASGTSSAGNAASSVSGTSSAGNAASSVSGTSSTGNAATSASGRSATGAVSGNGARSASSANAPRSGSNGPSSANVSRPGTDIYSAADETVDGVSDDCNLSYDTYRQANRSLIDMAGGPVAPPAEAATTTTVQGIGASAVTAVNVNRDTAAAAAGNPPGTATTTTTSVRSGVTATTVRTPAQGTTTTVRRGDSVTTTTSVRSGETATTVRTPAQGTTTTVRRGDSVTTTTSVRSGVTATTVRTPAQGTTTTVRRGDSTTTTTAAGGGSDSGTTDTTINLDDLQSLGLNIRQ